MNKVNESVPPQSNWRVLQPSASEMKDIRIKELEDQVKSLTIQKHGWHDWEDPDWGKKYALKQAYQTLSDENRELKKEKYNDMWTWEAEWHKLKEMYDILFEEVEALREV